MTEEEWRDSRFPHFPLPEQVVSSISITEWASKMSGIESKTMSHAAVPLLKAVLEQLKSGADSGVGPPGTSITKCNNFFTEPDDCKKMADALATEVKGGNLAGPMDPKEHPQTKINSFMAIPKPLGHCSSQNMACHTNNSQAILIHDHQSRLESSYVKM